MQQHSITYNYQNLSSPLVTQGVKERQVNNQLTCPIYYQGVVFSVEEFYTNLLSLSKKFLRRGTPLCRSHVSSMTGRCTCPIYHQGVVSVDKGSVISNSIEKKLTELMKKSLRPSPAAMFQA